MDQAVARSASTAVACVDRDLPASLNSFQVPAAHRRLVRTTDPIERRAREVRCRTRSIGTFVDHTSIERINYGLVKYFNRKYQTRICPAFQQKTRRVACGTTSMPTDYTRYLTLPDYESGDPEKLTVRGRLRGPALKDCLKVASAERHQQPDHDRYDERRYRRV